MAHLKPHTSGQPIRPGHRLRAYALPVSIVILLAVFALGLMLHARYRADMAAARDRIASGGQLVTTPCGTIEYGERGRGKPVLSIHGAGGGYDQGLVLGFEGVRTIAPSRFGYLNTPYPEDASAAAQADTYVCLLDALGVDRVVVVAFSAGGPSALQFALRHPERVERLVMASAISDARLIDSRPVDPAKDPVLSLLLTDFAFWTASSYFPDRTLAFFGISPDAQRRLRPEEHGRTVDVLRMILPMSMRKMGNFNDPAHWFERGDFALEEISVPTLVIHAVDDTFVPIAHGQHTASRIPNARLATFDYGGHFVFLRDAALAEIEAFVAR
jgi:2-hydroxy-6-oxonona-2,4-dienedioate hydrolase